jgi:hypothetical protein
MSAKKTIAGVFSDEYALCTSHVATDLPASCQYHCDRPVRPADSVVLPTAHKYIEWPRTPSVR